jgi:hypothetical protein
MRLVPTARRSRQRPRKRNAQEDGAHCGAEQSRAKPRTMPMSPPHRECRWPNALTSHWTRRCGCLGVSDRRVFASADPDGMAEIRRAIAVEMDSPNSESFGTLSSLPFESQPLGSSTPAKVLAQISNDRKKRLLRPLTRDIDVSSRYNPTYRRGMPARQAADSGLELIGRNQFLRAPQTADSTHGANREIDSLFFRKAVATTDRA